MKSSILTFAAAILIFINISTFAGPVNMKTAGKAAINFYYEQVAPGKNITFNEIKVLDVYTESRQGAEMYHVFNFDNGGFVIVAAENNVYPILAYSDKSYFSSTNQSPSHKAWMDTYVGQIEFFRQQKTAAGSTIDNLWSYYLTDNPAVLSKPKGTKDVEPFMVSNWGQGKYYNTLCPVDANGEDGHALVGCVATSLSMVLYYYRHPAQGTGSHGYYANNAAPGSNYGNYGWQFADFGNTTYQWNGMSNALSGTNANLSAAELCFHAGVSVDMKYGATASGSQTTLIPGALKTYFGYSQAAQFAYRSGYSQSAWESALMANLDGRKPLIYSGSQLVGYGHAWNMDGYEVNTQGVFFHCNWGWDGMSNGYFNINSLNPGGEAPFVSYQGAVLNIYPEGTYPPQCSGNKTITQRSGSFDDGSSYMNYTDNRECYWLIDPADSVKKISLGFNSFDTEENNDIVTIYDGPTTSFPVLGAFSGDSLPPAITSSGSKMLVKFTSNGSNNATGWQAYFTTQNPGFCPSTSSLTQPSGTFSDGSGNANYSDNTVCKWMIMPQNAQSVTISFTSFDVKPGDYINVYDLGTQTLLLEKFSGNTLPVDITANSGSAFIEFITDWNTTGSGFQANYHANYVGIDENSSIRSLMVYPNPASEMLNIEMTLNTRQDIRLSLMTVTGEVVYSEDNTQVSGTFNKAIALDNFAKGIYILKINGESGSLNKKVVID